MTTVITIACLCSTLYLLGVLTYIDLKYRLLPNPYVAGVFVMGITFQITTNFHFVSPIDIIGGMIAGGGLLFFVRYIANRAYNQDTLGLGDVKLMGAAGIWLGVEHIFLAISLGAFAGLVHGILYAHTTSKKTGENIPLTTLSIPAGPGFIFGIIAVGIFKFYTLPLYLGL